MGDKSEKSERSDKRDKERLEFADLVDRERVAEYLHLLANGLRAGSVTVSAAGQSMSLESAEQMRLEMEARHRPDKGSASIELEISWRTRSPAQAAREDRLTIQPGRSVAPHRAAATAGERP